MWSCGLCCQVAFSRLTIPQCMVISLDYLEFRKDELTPGFRECLCVDRLPRVSIWDGSMWDDYWVSFEGTILF